MVEELKINKTGLSTENCCYSKFDYVTLQVYVYECIFWIIIVNIINASQSSSLVLIKNIFTDYEYLWQLVCWCLSRFCIWNIVNCTNCVSVMLYFLLGVSYTTIFEQMCVCLCVNQDYQSSVYFVICVFKANKACILKHHSFSVKYILYIV